MSPHRMVWLALLIVAVSIPFGDYLPFFWTWIKDQITRERLLKLGVEVLVLIPAAFALELAVTGWERSSLRRVLVRPDASARVDSILFVIHQLRLPRLLTAPVAMAGLALTGNGVLAAKFGLTQWTMIDDPILGFCVCWLVRDFAVYWLHRAEHTRWLWPVHRMHHSATEMTILSSARSNLLANLVLDVAVLAPLSLFTLPAASLIACQMAVTFHNLITHSNWASDWGWFGRWVLVSPLHHRLHHGRRPEHWGANFGTIMLWDHLFGTFRQPDPQPVEIGTAHPAYETVGGAMRMLVVELAEVVGAGRLARALGIKAIAAPERPPGDPA